MGVFFTSIIHGDDAGPCVFVLGTEVLALGRLLFIHHPHDDAIPCPCPWHRSPGVCRDPGPTMMLVLGGRLLYVDHPVMMLVFVSLSLALVLAPRRILHPSSTVMMLVFVLVLGTVISVGVFFTSIIGWQYFVGRRTVQPGKCYVQVGVETGLKE